LVSVKKLVETARFYVSHNTLLISIRNGVMTAHKVWTLCFKHVHSVSFWENCSCFRTFIAVVIAHVLQSVETIFFDHVYFNDNEQEAGAWVCASSRHVERTNSRRTVVERLQTHNEQLRKDCKHV